MIFLYLSTAILAILGLTSFSGDFPLFKTLSVVAVLGLGVSWWQYNYKQIPLFKTAVNILLIIIAIRGFLPFFIDQPSDILSRLIEVWAYFLTLSAFCVISKRDFYQIHVSSLGLVVFSCFSLTRPPLFALAYIMAFFIAWIVTLRGMSLLQDFKDTKELSYGTTQLHREAIISTVFIFLAILFAFPIYRAFPRFAVPIPFLQRFLEQRYAVYYADFPRGRLMQLLAPPERMPESKDAGEYGVKIDPREPAQEELIGERKERTPPTLWHAPEISGLADFKSNLDKQIKELEQELQNTNRQLSQISREKDLSNFNALTRENERLERRKQELTSREEALEKERKELSKEYLRASKEQIAASLSTPQNKTLLEKLNQKIEELFGNLQEKTNSLEATKKDLARTEERIENVRDALFQEPAQSEAEKAARQILAKKEALQQQINFLAKESQSLEKELAAYSQLTQEEKIEPDASLALQQEEPEKEAVPKKLSVLDLLMRILLFILGLALIFLIGYIAAFFFSYWRDKRELIKKGLLAENYRLCIILTYRFLCKVLAIFGYYYALVTEPKKFSLMLQQRFQSAAGDISLISAHFHEAKYSSHTILQENAEKTLVAYRNMLEALKERGSSLQRMILKADFVFKV